VRPGRAVRRLSSLPIPLLMGFVLVAPACEADTLCPAGTAGPSCEPCAPGSFCSGADAPGETCAEGTWDDDHDPATACEPWSVCAPGESVSAAGTNLDDRECEPCPPGASSSGENATRCHLQWLDVALVAGRTCALDVDGHAVCWGRRRTRSSPNDAPNDPPEETAFESLSMSQDLGCGILADTGEVVCWGDRYNGFAAPDGCSSQPRSEAHVVFEGVAFEEVSVGELFQCGVRRSDRKVFCWGECAPAETPDEALSSIAVGSWGACGLLERSGEAVCWGAAYLHPQVVSDVPPGVTFSAVAIVKEYACGTRQDDGQVVCWGKSWWPWPAERGWLDDFGDGPPAEVAFRSLAIAGAHNPGVTAVCGIGRDDGEAACWGSQYTMGMPLTPPPGLAFERIVAGTDHVCGITSSRELVCWGSDEFGQISGQPRL